jgi:hypothetical protein
MHYNTLPGKFNQPWFAETAESNEDGIMEIEMKTG